MVNKQKSNAVTQEVLPERELTELEKNPRLALVGEGKDITYVSEEQSFISKLYTLTTTNTLRYWLLLSPCIALGVHYSSVMAFAISYGLLFGFTELLYFFYETSYFDTACTVTHSYDFCSYFTDKPNQKGLDLGFVYCNGDYKKSCYQAQLDKFDHVWDMLGLEPGMHVIDVGCGFGDWMSYAKDRGVNIIGINFTESHVQQCRARGLEVVQTDWKAIPHNKKLQKILYGRADAVTLFDTIENHVDSRWAGNIAKCDEIYGSLFEMVGNFMKPDSKCKRVWNCCIHSNWNIAHIRGSPLKMMKACIKDPPLIKSLFTMYILDRCHSGSYPDGVRDTLSVAANKAKMALVYRRDVTIDYYMTGVVYPAHFGTHVVKWNWERAGLAMYGMIAMPFWFHMYLWQYHQIWNYQFQANDIRSSMNRTYWSMWQIKDKNTIQEIKGEKQTLTENEIRKKA